MSDNIDYGRCKNCGIRFYTYSYAWQAFANMRCPECRLELYRGTFSDDFWRAIYASWSKVPYVWPVSK